MGRGMVAVRLGSDQNNLLAQRQHEITKIKLARDD
jgi:hypothetical protein